jgi:hypothetical protein
LNEYIKKEKKFKVGEYFVPSVEKAYKSNIVAPRTATQMEYGIQGQSHKE